VCTYVNKHPHMAGRREEDARRREARSAETVQGQCHDAYARIMPCAHHAMRR